MAESTIPNADYPERSSTPQRPPFSPITPTLPQSQLAMTSNFSSSVGSEPEPRSSQDPPSETSKFIQEPDSLPIDQDDNVDIMALQSALGILQNQRLQSIQDMKQLRDIKKAVIADPIMFTEELIAAQTRPLEEDKLGLGPRRRVSSSSDSEDSEDERQNGSNSMLHRSTRPAYNGFPEPQNIVRCPPINWAKYHIVGESLDKLHEEQRSRPYGGRGKQTTRAPKHHILAPYDPIEDKFDDLSTKTLAMSKPVEDKHDSSTRRSSGSKPNRFEN
ncbi:MAG: hypothetical protein M1834_000002 [Cirrosporium novae-zelandiae]|nr:MAG: hypothetical protein M1834_000002 [Cirrosporium novae-zelandiae]